jgi:MFS family permease
MIGVTVAIMVFGLTFGALFVADDLVRVGLFLVIGLSLMGLTYGPLGTLLAELFPPAVRYTGSSLTFNLAGILGASLAPYVATSLATKHGIAYVGYYLTGAALLSLIALLLVRSPARQPEAVRV